MQIQDIAVRLLQWADVLVIARAELERRQDLRGCQLSQGQRLGNALSGNENLWVAHAGQLQRRGQINDLLV